MELVGFELSRLVSLSLTRRIAGQIYWPAALHALVERYHFSRHPSSYKEMTEEPISFAHGAFGDVAIDTFDIYSDGIIVTSRSRTDVLDEFVADVTEWMKVEFGMERLETHTISKIYESHILVRSDPTLLKVLEPLNEIAELLAIRLNKVSRQDAKFQPFSLALAADQSTLTGLKPIPFRVERKVGLEFATNLYVSSAPLPTNEHLAVLSKLEELK
ncbi:hypothetical protein [Hyphomicrobium sp. NDB2Meth4]|uniref:hypothetical protein n=1 Tax=Hyphomicrobium sp. NDB2Meth4 TaxID=1892846 RepID=UPI000B266AE8|nr:hypothetical protein [Hyphomicrobium sp. NDB2Meth4]